LSRPKKEFTIKPEKKPAIEFSDAPEVQEINFTVMGDCIAQGRPRTAIIDGHAVVYDPAKNKVYKNYIKMGAAEAMQGRPLMEHPIEMDVYVFRPLLKSFSKKKRQAALDQTLLPAGKPDVDNLYKTVSDACEGVVYLNDSQITDLVIGKRYSDTPRVEVTVKEL
jgi:Holliday junction resolvase RusA-like endonuclease